MLRVQKTCPSQFLLLELGWGWGWGRKSACLKNHTLSTMDLRVSRGKVPMRHVCLALTARLSRSSRYLFWEPWRCFSSLLPAVTLRTVNPTVSCSGTAPVDSESHNSWQLIPLRETKELCSSVTQHHGVAVPESLFSGLRFKTKEISMRKRTHSMANRRLHQASLLTSNHSKGQRGQARPQTLSDKSV